VDKKPVIMVSICAVVLLVVASLSNVVGYQTQNIKKPLPTSRGNWLYVGGSGPGNYSQIQDAIDNASDGDTIMVFSGQYQHIIIDKQLSLIGINTSKGNPPLIDGGNSYDCVIILAGGCLFENFHVKNGDAGFSKKGVWLKSNNNTVSKCLLFHTGKGLVLNSSSGNLIYKNEMTEGWNGITLVGYCNNNSFLNNYVYAHSEHEIKGSGNGNIWENNRVVGDITGNGFAFSGCSRCIFKSNYIASNRQMGIQMSNSENMTFINNTFIENGFIISGDTLYHLTTHVMSGNTVNGKPLYYFANKNNVIVPIDAGQIILTNCSHCTVFGVDILRADVGIALWYSSYNTILSNKVNSSLFEEGIKLVESHNNIISKNILSGHRNGILLSNSNNNQIEENIIQSNDIGISIQQGTENVLYDNQVISCRIGIEIHNFGSNNISYNKISRCSWWGLFLWESSNNFIGTNWFFVCDQGVYTIGADDSVFSGNRFFLNGNGLTITYSIRVNILENNFSGNKYGISISEQSSCLVKKNNFFLNLVSAVFSQIDIFSDIRNYWISNYWNRPRLSPYFIHGRLIVFELFGNIISIPWINIDWSPALKPYDIPEMR
jgi:parallel beta-helix repeat protein